MRSPLSVARPTPSRHLAYQPALDGIRAYALIVMLLYHADVWLLPAGFLSIDIFFALSGYLITTLMLREQDRSGTVALRQFWIRRIRRLFPAMLAMLVLIALYAALVADPVALNTIRADAIATLLYSENWRLVFSDQSYFEAFAAPSPLRHAWSLAVEEQWYVIWPIAVVGMLKLSKGKIRPWTPVIVIAAVDSALLMAGIYSNGADPSRVYYGTDTRAQTLLIGAALAFFLHGREPTDRQRRAAGWLGLACLAGITVAFSVVDETDPRLYHGGYLLLAFAATALVAGAALEPKGLLGRFLSLPPLPAIGRLSYGLYLYHWPIYLTLTEDRTGIDGPALVVVRLVATWVVSMLSYQYVELPVREGALRHSPLNRWSATRITLGTSLAVVGLVVLATIGGTSGPTTGSTSAFAAGDVKVLVVGDSVGLGLGNGYPEDLGGLSVRSSGIAGCGLLDARAIVPADAGDVARTAATMAGECEKRRQEEWTDALTVFQPDVVVVEWGGYEVFPQDVAGQRLEFATPAFDALVVDELRRNIGQLGSAGADVALLTVHCFSKGNAPERNDQSRIAHLNELARRAADEAGVPLLDLHARVCPEGDHQPQLEGVELYADGIHFTRDGARLVWEWLQPELLALAS